MLPRASKALFAILVVALVVRVAVIVATPDYAPLFDAKDYDRHAQSIADGNGYPPPQLGTRGPTAFRPPAYPVMLAGVRLLGGGWTAERLLGALLGVATALLVYLIARRIWGERVALVAGGLAAVFPPIAFLNASLISEVLFLPLVLASVLAVLHYRSDPRLRWVAAAGVLCGLATLTRTVGLPVALALAAGAWIGRPRFARASLVAPLAVLLATAVTVAPWVVRNAVVFHRYVGISTAAGWALAATYNQEARDRARHPGEPKPNVSATSRYVLRNRGRLDEAQLIDDIAGRARRLMRSHPDYVLGTFVWNVPRVFELERRRSFGILFQAQTLEGLGTAPVAKPLLVLGSLYLVLVAAAVGIGTQLRARVRAPAFLWAAPVLLLLPALALYGLPRYRAPVDPFIVLLAAVGAVAVWDRMRGGKAAPVA